MRPVSTERVQKGVAQIWERDLSLTLMLIILVLLLFVVVPLSTLGDISSTGDVLLSGLVSLMGISGAVSGSDTRLGRAIGIALMTLPTLLGGLELVRPDVPHIRVARGIVTLAGLVYLTFITLRHVLRGGDITRARIEGAIAVYLLVGLIFSEIFALLLILNPDALHVPTPATTWLAIRGQAVYFSLVTLTTVGYGDIVPVSLAARSLANLESLIGQLYPAILIGRLVSMQLTANPPAQPPPENL